MRGPALQLFAMVAVLACGDGVTQVELDLVQGDCSGTDLGEVAVLSVEVYGSDSEGLPCALGRRCISVDGLNSLEDISTALSEVNQPLVDSPFADAELVVVTGHASNDCFAFDDRRMCGFADVADVRSGALELRMNCSDCSEQRFPLCQ